jgi:hypothetical protein
LRLYVANETRQNIRFYFRLPENDKMFMLPIAIGEQQAIPADLDSAGLRSVIHQLEQGFGAVSSKDLDRSKFFVGVCYSDDQPIPAKLIERGINNNLIILEKRGIEFRKETAVANHAAMDFGVGGKNRLVGTESSITEIPTRGGQTNIDETVIVRAEGGDAKPRNPSSRRKAG